MINGHKYDWESVEIKLPNGTAIGITDINYGDEKGAEARFGKGGKARGWGNKNYKASGDMTLDRDEYEELKRSLGGSVYNDRPFPIVVSYGNEDMSTVTDTLPDIKITKQATGAKQDGENAGAMKLDFTIFSPIKWGDKAAQ